MGRTGKLDEDLHMGMAITMMYLAHRQGTPIGTLAEEMHVPVQWLQERLEAARLCYEFQVGFSAHP